MSALKQLISSSIDTSNVSAFQHLLSFASLSNQNYYTASPVSVSDMKLSFIITATSSINTSVIAVLLQTIHGWINRSFALC